MMRNLVPQRSTQAFVLAAFTLAPVGFAQKQLSPDTALYARTVLITHGHRPSPNGKIVAAVTAFTGSTHVDVYGSKDEGASFSVIGTIQDADFAGGLCCGTLFELPRTVGNLHAGTLLWAGSVGQNVHQPGLRMQIEVYSSIDRGRSWSFRLAITSPNTGGLWEPQFALADDGALVMTYSDELQQPTYSQMLTHTRTYNGATWQDAGPAGGKRHPCGPPRHGGRQPALRRRVSDDL